jgi:hypothetical protein
MRGASRWLVLVVLFGVAVTRLPAQSEIVVSPRDTLVFKDGDRVHGKLLRNADNLIVFLSDRFGELRVPSADAVIIPAEQVPASAVVEPKPAVAAIPVAKPAARPAAATASTGSAQKKAPAATATASRAAERAAAKAEAERVEAEKLTVWDRFTPSVLTAQVRKLFGPWKGRLAFSTEIVSDTAKRNNYSTEGRLARKWERNELQLSGRYDFVETNNVPTTDLLKGTGNWRHEFNNKIFGHYRPTFEWNRASRKGDYILLQQEIGAGLTLLTTPGRKVRVGVSQNLFDVWNMPPNRNHTFRTRESIFEETELALPWRMRLTQRTVWYPVGSRRDGWENRVELNKKLTETLSTSVRHEIRRDHPDRNVQDFDRLRLMFALDF